MHVLATRPPSPREDAGPSPRGRGEGGERAVCFAVMADAHAAEIRLVKPEEAAAYVAMRREALVDTPLAFAGSPGADAPSDEVWVRERLGERWQAIAGAFVGTRMIGSAGVYRDHRMKMAHRAMIWGVWVSPEWRGRGVGERLVRMAMETASAWEGVRTVSLSVGAGQIGAQRLYARLGFVAWGVEPSVMVVDGAEHDEVHMQKRVRGEE